MWHVLAQQLAHSKRSVLTIRMTKTLMMMIKKKRSKEEEEERRGTRVSKVVVSPALIWTGFLISGLGFPLHTMRVVGFTCYLLLFSVSHPETSGIPVKG